MATIALHMPATIPNAWVDALVASLPEHKIARWPGGIGDPARIEYVLMLKPEPHALTPYVNLKAMFSTAAGVDHLLSDETLPKHVPLCRLTHPEMAARMSEYVLLHVLRYHRQLPTYQAQQARNEWKSHPQKAASDVTVGIMGLGQLGRDAARKLQVVGFKVTAWSRSAKTEPDIECFAGTEQLDAFLAKAEFLVSFLPLTESTRKFLDARVFRSLPKGAVVINVGRGGCLNEDDLLAVLDAGHLGGAVLDVFQTEPLPVSSALWSHPKVTVTPHNSTTTQPRMLAPYVRENIARIARGEPPLNIVDRARGY